MPRKVQSIFFILLFLLSSHCASFGAEEEKTVPLKDQINGFFGTYIVSPMWSYFLGFPVTEERVLMHKNGRPLFDRDGNAVMDTPKPVIITNEAGEKVPKLDDAGNIIYNDPQQVISRPKAVIHNGKQIDVSHLHYIVLANGAPITLASGSAIILEEGTLDAITIVKDDNGDPVKGEAAVYQGKALMSANGEKILGENISFLPSPDPQLTTNAAGLPLLTVSGNIVVDADNNQVLLSQTSLSNVGLPFIVIVLAIGGLFFTLFFLFINVRLFKHAIDCVRGKFDNPDDDGEVSHFKALTSALSATVGLGNIAGVAIAIAMGGPGAIFWMWLVAFFGMSMKFSSCSLAQIYRRIDSNGKVLGGPMVYLDDGIKQHYPKLAWLGKSLAILFCICCVFGAFGGGNLFQGNQTYSLLASQFYGSPLAAPAWLPWTVGIVLAVTAGLVLIGGIKRIGSVTSKMVPLMCATYSILCLIILLINFTAIPGMIAEIFIQAFKPDALIAGGFLGVFVTGMKRAAFSNEAGLGSAAIAHAAAKTKEPIREGVVAMLGPFIDTILVCSMTALTILVTNAHLGEGNGVELTRRAFETLGSWAPWVLMVIVIVFAYSTIISWSYYAERVLEYLFGPVAILPYRVLYVIAIVFGPIFTLGNVLDFSDLMLLSMAFPNIIGMILLSPTLRGRVNDYCARLKSGEMKPYEPES